MAEARAERTQIFTIGHSNQSLESFVGLLRRHEIAVVADVRSYPRSTYARQFDQDPLRQALQAQRIRYVFMGRELGGRPSDDEYYDAKGHVLYSRVNESPLFDRGIRQLESRDSALPRGRDVRRGGPGRLPPPSPDRPRSRRGGITVLHIRGDGRLQTEEDLLKQETESTGEGGQLPLFETPIGQPQGAAWRSTRSVSPKRAPPSSSER